MLLLNEDVKIPARSPILITGAARGGTSFVASICHHLGLPLGDESSLYENWFLQQAVSARDWELVRQLAGAMSSVYPKWGWKLPALTQYLETVRVLLPTFRFIFVMKNPISITMTKNRILAPEDLGAEMQKITMNYTSIAKFSRTCAMPMLFIPYENAIIKQPTTIRCIADFCNLKVKNVTQVAVRVSADRRRYLSDPFPKPPGANALGDLLNDVCAKKGKHFIGYPSRPTADTVLFS